MVVFDVDPTVYIPNFNGGDLLLTALAHLEAQTKPTKVVVVDNGSSDGSIERVRADFPETQLIELGKNIGFGRALNLGVRQHPGDPVVFLNSDTEAEPRFVEGIMDEFGAGTEMVAGVLLLHHAPERIDSAGVVADRTLMGFDYLNGEPADSAATAPPPLGPTGGAALFRLDAFERVGGFDERIFAYYEDLDLALRLRTAGASCRLAAQARALHRHSATLGARSAAKHRLTGWSRGYMLRRYGVMRDPRLALRVLAREGPICAGQIARSHTTAGLTGRLAGWRAGRGLDGRRVPDDALLDISTLRALQLRKRRHSV